MVVADSFVTASEGLIVVVHSSHILSPFVCVVTGVVVKASAVVVDKCV